MKIIRTKTADLSIDPANVRMHSSRNIEAIKSSLRRFGQQHPIVIDSNNVVRIGNGRLLAARELDWETINCIVSDLESAELAALAIADNRTAELADWDNHALMSMLAAMPKDMVRDAGFSEEDMNDLIARTADPEPPSFSEGSEEECDNRCPKCSYEWDGDPRAPIARFSSHKKVEQE